jgi:hypothetical protein
MKALATVDTSVGEWFETLKIIGNGDLSLECASAMREIVTASQHTGKKSELIMKIIVEPDNKSDAFRVSGSVKVKLPAEPVKASLFFPTADGHLSRIDSRQRTMFGDEEETRDYGTYQKQS